jgi:hypothetical protein
MKALFDGSHDVRSYSKTEQTTPIAISIDQV